MCWKFPLMLIQCISKPDWLFNTQLREHRADWLIWPINEKATLNIDMPYLIWTSFIILTFDGQLQVMEAFQSKRSKRLGFYVAEHLSVIFNICSVNLSTSSLELFMYIVLMRSTFSNKSFQLRGWQVEYFQIENLSFVQLSPHKQSHSHTILIVESWECSCRLAWKFRSFLTCLWSDLKYLQVFWGRWRWVPSRRNILFWPSCQFSPPHAG